MKLRKDGQKLWNKLKKEGYSDEEIAESYVFPMEYESDEEKQKDLEGIKKFIADQMAKRTPEEIKAINEYAEKLRKEDEQNRKEKSENN